jgi:hypothetical protein
MHRGYTCLWRKIWSNTVLAEPDKKFSRLEAWLYIFNVLAAGKNDEISGLQRGGFTANSRYLARKWNWPRTTVQRFFKELEMAEMITRVNTGLGHIAGQLEGHQESRFIIRNYETYNPARAADLAGSRTTSRANIKEVLKEGLKEIEKKDTPAFATASAGACVSPRVLIEMFQQHNQALPEVKAVTAERLRKCRSRINQAVRDGCLEQYLADFSEAVKKAQQTPFLRGEGARGWRASFDWFVANRVNIYAVLEGKYDGNDIARRTSRGDPIYIPRQ